MDVDLQRLFLGLSFYIESITSMRLSQIGLFVNSALDSEQESCAPVVQSRHGVVLFDRIGEIVQIVLVHGSDQLLYCD